MARIFVTHRELLCLRNVIQKAMLDKGEEAWTVELYRLFSKIQARLELGAEIHAEVEPPKHGSART